jgi:hypothetical protein
MIKLFYNGDEIPLEDRVNEFLNSTEKTVNDIKIAAGYGFTVVMVIYTEDNNSTPILHEIIHASLK